MASRAAFPYLPYLLVTLLLVCGSLSFAHGQPAASELQILSLVKAHWRNCGCLTNWGTNKPCGDWAGLECDADNRVISLNLSSKGLTRGIPRVLGKLHKLKTLDLSFNSLVGSIRYVIGSSHSIDHLYLNNNQLTNNVLHTFDYTPSKVNGTFTSIDLSNNYLTGVVGLNIVGFGDAPLATNCFEKFETPGGQRDAVNQRSAIACSDFCNCTHSQGACFGKGTCSFNTTGSALCACHKGYERVDWQFGCKYLVPDYPTPPFVMPPPPYHTPPPPAQGVNYLRDPCFSRPNNRKSIIQASYSSTDGWYFIASEHVTGGVDRLYATHNDVVPPKLCHYVVNLKLLPTMYPVQVTQTIRDLTPGTRFKLTFSASGTRGSAANCSSNHPEKPFQVNLFEEGGFNSQLFNYTVTAGATAGVYETFRLFYTLGESTVLTVSFNPLYVAESDNCGALVSRVRLTRVVV